MNRLLRDQQQIDADEPSFDTSCGACGDCASRRTFIGRLSTAIVALMVGADASSLESSPLPLAQASGTQTGSNEKSYPIPGADGVTIDRDAEIILVRFQGRLFAFNLACPHEHAALRWKAQDGRFQCPRHGSRYQQDGTFISGRATRNMDRFQLKRTGETVAVDLNRLFRSDQDKDGWSGAALTL